MATAQAQAIPVVALQGQSGAVPASSLFGMPGITQWTEQVENNNGTTVTLNATNQVDAQFAANFKQTDIVFGWDMYVSVAQTYTASGGTFTSSPHFPYNQIGPLALNFQNQFDTVNLPDGFSAALMQITRPRRYGLINKVLAQNTQSDAYSAQPNNLTASNYTNASATVKYILELNPAVQLDAYYDLEADGLLYLPKATPIKTWVTPQLMSGTNRVITPRVRFNGQMGTNADTNPITVTGGTPTYSGTATLNFRRRAIYQPGGTNDTPPIFNWQYSRGYQRFSLSGVSSASLPVPQTGQILSIHMVFWDPTLNSNVGGPIPIANISEIDLIYGSGFYRYQDSPTQTQNRYFEQHGILLPEGVLCWDMAIRDDGSLTNAYALNTLTTSAPQVSITFTGTQSSSAYCYMLIEALRYVAIQ